jgi:hypothetical protein
MCLLLHLQRRYKNEAAQGQAASIASVRLENELRLQFDYPWGCIRTQTRAIDGRRLTNGLRDLTELIAIHVGVREGKVRMIEEIKEPCANGETERSPTSVSRRMVDENHSGIFQLVADRVGSDCS